MRVSRETSEERPRPGELDQRTNTRERAKRLQITEQRTGRRRRRGAGARNAYFRLCGRACGMRVRADVQAVALEIAVQAGAADAENLRSSEAVAIT